VVREHDRETNRDIYYSCEDEGYADRLEQALKTQAEMAGFPETSVESIKLHSVAGRKIVVKYYGILRLRTSRCLGRIKYCNIFIRMVFARGEVQGSGCLKFWRRDEYGRRIYRSSGGR